jgi:Zn-dependent alcohol dehydrogenase
VQGKYQNQPPFPWIPGSEVGYSLTIPDLQIYGLIKFHSSLAVYLPLRLSRKAALSSQARHAYSVLLKAHLQKSKHPSLSYIIFCDFLDQHAICRIKVDWRNLLVVPEGMSYDAASTLFVTYPTSYAALVLRAQLKKDEWCLVHAAAGGVGLCAVQIAKAIGAKVIATAGSAEKLEVAKKHGGADFVLDYRQDGWQKKVLEITGGKGANVIYDPVGMILPSLKCIAWNGRALVVGFAAGTIEKVSLTY